MKPAGFVQAVKSRGKYYFYVRIAFRDENKKKRNKNIASLGQKENALSLINSWMNDSKTIPEVLGKYDKEDFLKWISYIENK